MAYTAPYIDDTGLHTNTYQDILDYYIAAVKQIYGSDLYLETDSADYQLLSVFARAVYENEQCAQMNYQARSPVTCTTDDAMDGLLTINGLKRKPATYSTVGLTLTGIPYTQITGGVVESTNGHKWNLPSVVTLDSTGKAIVTATAQEIGSITADANTVTKIVTPTYGWTSVTNTYQAFVGQPIETLAQLKERQQESVSPHSKTPKASVETALYDVDGVTDFVVYENDTDVEVSYNTSTKEGGPAHSITCVVEGGTSTDIAKSINLSKTLGCYIAGDIVVPVTDVYGSQNNIRFYRPNILQVYATFTIQALPGYSSAVADSLKEAVVAYLQKLRIGNNLYLSQMWEAALSVSPDVKPYFSLKSVVMGLSEENQEAKDIIADFDDRYTTIVNNLTVTVVE